MNTNNSSKEKLCRVTRSGGFLSDKTLVAKLETTLKLKDVDLNGYGAVHVAGGVRPSIFTRTRT
jgi:hypothetical protein